MQIAQIAKGQRGSLRIGMECHPCYQWLLKIVAPFLRDWPDVDVDVKQAFQFGGIAALFNYDIDVLVTPDPLHKPGLKFTPVFDYEQVIVLPENHLLADQEWLAPSQLIDEVLLSYPVEVERLDIFNQFFLPAGCAPRRHKTIETTDILLQMVAAERGFTALPDWMGESGVKKQIFLGQRESEAEDEYLSYFMVLAGKSIVEF